MKIFDRAFKQPSGRIPSWVAYAVAGFAFLGFFDSLYLTAQKFAGVIPPCSLTAGFSCETVLTSQYAQFFGIPVSLFGVAYYCAVLWCALSYATGGKRTYALGMALLPLAGVAATLWFLYLQAFVLRAYCAYCLFSAAVSGALAVFALVIWYYVAQTRNEHHSEK
ncbi:MAG: vitamin K epoxide reductase family protein [Candidatus Wildermuthbacteria bacterium]|nr:vitamin K epoxide reductase family protein [Candidatus Wildermuthbacteria bacterium]